MASCGYRQVAALCLDMADGNSNIAAPDIDDRRAAPVIAGIHAEKVFLLEVGMERQHPVGPFLVRTALIGPEGRGIAWRLPVRTMRTSTLSIHVVRVVGPSLDRKFARASIGVLNIEERHRGEVIVHRDGDRFGQCSRFSGQNEPLASSERVGHSFTSLRGEREVGPSLVLACHALGDSEWSHRRIFTIETSDYAAA